MKATSPQTFQRASDLRAAGLACLLLCAGFAAALAWLTQGLRVWTLDDRREAMVAQRQLLAAPVMLRDARGKLFSPWSAVSPSAQVYLVDFVYTRCATICAALGPEFLRLQQDIRDQGLAGRVALLSISIDPGYDDTPRLAAYEAQQRADPGIWRISAPTTLVARKDLLHALDVVAIPDGIGGYVHNGEIHVIDGRGVVLGLYDYGSFHQALATARQAVR